MASLSREQKLPAEEKSARIIGSCNDMLEEMDLIEQVDSIRRHLQPHFNFCEIHNMAKKNMNGILTAARAY